MALNNKVLKLVLEIIYEMLENGSLEPEYAKSLIEAVRELDHARTVRDRKRVEAAIDKIARLFVRLD